MTNDSETVREVCAEIQTQKYQTAFTDRDVVAWRDRILSAHEREMAAKDAEIARLKESSCEYALPDRGCTAEDKHFHRTIELEREVARLKAALKPVMECAVCKVDGTAVADGEICTSSDYGVCDYEGNELDWHGVAECLDNVREAQRIILEAWDDKNYFWNNRVAKKCREVKEC